MIIYNHLKKKLMIWEIFIGFNNLNFYLFISHDWEDKSKYY